jgi:Flp pilus assembly protein TadG
MASIRVPCRKAGRRRGAALAETAIVLFVLILITLGAIEYGWLFYCAQRVTNAARQGARIESVLNAPPGVAQATMLELVSDLSPDPPPSVSTADGFVTASVRVPAKGNPKVDLLRLAFLPVPENLGAHVKMAKEGQFTVP